MARDEVAEFVPVRVGGPRRTRGPLALATWIVGFVAIVALAVGGRLATPGDAEIAGGPSGDPVATDADRIVVGPADPWPPDVSGHFVLPATVTLLQPPTAGFEVTTPMLVVEGEVRGPVAYVLIRLEARGNRVIDRSTQWITAHGGDRPPRAPRFSAAFDLPALRPNGRMWVSATAYDAGGMPLGETRRAVDIGPLLDGAVVRVPPPEAPLTYGWSPEDLLRISLGLNRFTIGDVIALETAEEALRPGAEQGP